MFPGSRFKKLGKKHPEKRKRFSPRVAKSANGTKKVFFSLLFLPFLSVFFLSLVRSYISLLPLFFIFFLSYSVSSYLSLYFPSHLLTSCWCFLIPSILPFPYQHFLYHNVLISLINKSKNRIKIQGRKIQADKSSIVEGAILQFRWMQFIFR